MQATTRIGLPPGTKNVRLERNDTCRSWFLWLSFDKTMSLGTYLALRDDGSMDRVTIHPDGFEQVINIKPATKSTTT